MTRAQIEDRLKAFEDRLVQQTAERERTRSVLAQMEVACHQLAGAIAALRGADGVSTLRVSSTGTVEERLHRLEQATNYEEEVLALTLVNAEIKNATAGVVGVASMPWKYLRPLLPDDRWAIYLSGLIQNSTVATISLVYVKDDGTRITLAAGSAPASVGYQKFAVGPFPARGPLAPTVPLEEIPVWGMDVQFSGGTVNIWGCTLWLRMTPRST
jgi:hypothetical protein